MAALGQVNYKHLPAITVHILFLLKIKLLKTLQSFVMESSYISYKMHFAQDLLGGIVIMIVVIRAIYQFSRPTTPLASFVTVTIKKSG
jgi:hypothetical protein